MIARGPGGNPTGTSNDFDQFLFQRLDFVMADGILKNSDSGCWLPNQGRQADIDRIGADASYSNPFRRCRMRIMDYDQARVLFDLSKLKTKGPVDLTVDANGNIAITRDGDLQMGEARVNLRA